MTIAIAAALAMEFYTFRRCMGKVDKLPLGIWQHYVWGAHENRIILLETGIGLQKAAGAIKFLLRKYSLDCLINFGSVGMINEGLQVGDAFLAEEIISDADGKTISTNKQLTGALGMFLDTEFRRYRRGRLLSAREPITKRGDRLKLANTFSVDAVDMEAFALAQIAAGNNLPFASLKMISDRANALTRLEFWKNLPSVDRTLGKLMYGFIQSLKAA